MVVSSKKKRKGSLSLQTPKIQWNHATQNINSCMTPSTSGSRICQHTMQQSTTKCFLQRPYNLIGEQMGVTDPSYPRGYLHRFKSRRRKKRKKIINQTVLTWLQCNQDLQRAVQVYDQENIANLDETGLFYRPEPNYTLTTKKKVERRRAMT